MFNYKICDKKIDFEAEKKSSLKRIQTNFYLLKLL